MLTKRRWCLKIALLLLGLVSLWLAWLWLTVNLANLPSYADVRDSYSSSESSLLDRNGVEIQRWRTDFKQRIGNWLELEQISPLLQQAVLTSEDKRFYRHGGVDWRALAAALKDTLNGHKRGASTISMQLYDLLQRRGKRTTERNLVNKLKQSFGAWRIERSWTKQQILTAYLNLLPFRGENIGVDAITRVLFDKYNVGLSATEASIEAVLIRAPNAAAYLVAQRACQLKAQLDNIATANDCLPFEMLTQAVFLRNTFSTKQGIALAAAYQAQKTLASTTQTQSTTLHSTLDAKLQQFAVTSLNQQLYSLATQNVTSGAVLVLDNATGEILAYVNSSINRNNELDFIQAKRQVGSTLKPFLAAQALAEKKLTAASLIYDSPNEFKVGNSLYIPQNYDHGFKGWVSLRRVIGSSLNIPSIKILDLITPSAFAQQLRQLGINLPEDGDYYGLSLALGSLDMSLAELTNAYRVLANAGRFQPIAPLVTAEQPRKPHFTPVFAPAVAYIISDILSDDNARSLTFGLGSILQTKQWSAVKTGTSKDMRDNWAVGYTPRYTVGVWVGNADGAPMQRVSGTSGAAPVWAQVINYLQQNTQVTPPTRPTEVIAKEITFAVADWSETQDPRVKQQAETKRVEYFLAGTQSAIIARPAGRQPSVGSRLGLAVPSATTHLIQSPQNNTIMALDPDIPPANQQLLLATNYTEQAVKWLVNKQLVGAGKRVHWLPDFGNKTIELVTVEGQVLDKIKIQVRGTPPDWLVP